tara:strand:- start:412 stop:519 length:108 start_codon:yes stop_codon:yes gene_type:complete
MQVCGTRDGGAEPPVAANSKVGKRYKYEVKVQQNE